MVGALEAGGGQAHMVAPRAVHRMPRRGLNTMPPHPMRRSHRLQRHEQVAGPETGHGRVEHDSHHERINFLTCWDDAELGISPASAYSKRMPALRMGDLVSRFDCLSMATLPAQNYKVVGLHL